MSAMYAQAITQGIGAIHVATGGDNAGTIQAYNEAYSAQAQRYATLDAKNAAENNISAINQDKILSNVQIQMNQQEAEAAAQVSAAVAGVEGSSVDAGMYQIGANASMQVAQAEAKADQLTEQQLANVANAQVNYDSIPELGGTSNASAAIAGASQAFGTISEEDFGNMEAQLSTWSA
tara:strand:- start:1727 stop:2260 length:534 start_codon:yes stop_codon:yes gene_type:complete